MKEYIYSLLPRLSQYSKSLNNSAILVDHPWIFINDDGQKSKFVFRPNNDLLVSVQGEVQKGRWEYLPALNALLIEQSGHSQLFSQGFVNTGLLVLNRDETNDMFILVNQNLIPDLDVVKYLSTLVPLEAPKYVGATATYAQGVDEPGFEIVEMKSPAIQVRIKRAKNDSDLFAENNRIEYADGTKLEDCVLMTKDSSRIKVVNGTINDTSNVIDQFLVSALIIIVMIALLAIWGSF